MSSYKDYVNTQGSWAPVTRNSETKDLATSLLSDLKVCTFMVFVIMEKVYIIKNGVFNLATGDLSGNFSAR